MNVNISARLDQKTAQDLEIFIEEWHTDRSEAIRRILSKALVELKIERALTQLKNHRISIGKAAEECNLSIWEMMELVKEKNIDWTNYTKKELEGELKLLGGR